MDITFKALKETDIRRHVNRLKKHSSNDVKRLVKHLVWKWKDIVDEWVKLDPPAGHETSALMVDGDSPPSKRFPKMVITRATCSSKCTETKRTTEDENRRKVIQIQKG
ncbi:hypothetical protein Q3G72_028792 [Acer saccharum]|nr:hypothetical protein Q3G72_028792 [Acer saccharum]